MSKTLAPALLTLLALAHLTCNQAILTAPPGSTLTLFANPPFIPAHGGVSVISALVVEPAGTPVPDGTVVQFFTSLGRIDEQGKTNDGVARVNLISDARSGTASVTAVSGGPGVAPAPSPTASPGTGTGTGSSGGSGSASINVVIGSALPVRVIVTADPQRIRSSDPRHSRIVANVSDASGNPVANVPVIFVVGTITTSSPTPSPSPTATTSLDVTASDETEFMASGGRPVFTDSNGQAIDSLETRHPKNADPKTVTVSATTANGIVGSTTVTIN